MDFVKYRDCGAIYYKNQRICPVCKSMHKIVYISCNPITIKNQIAITGMKAKKTNLAGKKKHIWEWTNRKEIRNDKGTPVQRYKLVDRENDSYEETVIDLTTNKVIHNCKEPLSQHTGHGSDKRKNR